MNIAALFIRRPVMTTLVMASLLLAGFFGYRQLPIAAIPRIEVPTITVTVQYPGASPDTMAVSVAAPLERQFATIAGITAITSLSTQGLTQITLEFELNRSIDADDCIAALVEKPVEPQHVLTRRAILPQPHCVLCPEQVRQPVFTLAQGLI